MSSDENGPKGGIISSDEKEMKTASGSMSSHENGRRVVSYLQMKEINSASASMSSDENGPKGGIYIFR